MNTFKYFPHTEEEIQEMLAVCGVKSLDELYSDVPESIRFRKEYEIPEAQSELDLYNRFHALDLHTEELVCFAGGGVYDHYSPSIVKNLVQRSEFLTSYTPYQAEISQGTLHYIFEYQSMMAELTGMDISNASMYDGATATAEAALMSVAAAKKANRVLISDTVDPKTIRVVETYAKYHGIDLQRIAAKDGVTDKEDLRQQLAGGEVAGVILQMPNYYGIVEDFTGVADMVHAEKALLTINSVASDLAVLKTPAEWGADIAVGDGQSLGIPLSMGGPSVGYMCCTEKLIRKMPGRIVGMTKDNRGQRAFVLTLQAREQHIRRQKATSNICSNQSLMALYVTIYLAVMGKQGLREVAERSYANAHYLCEQLQQTGHFKLTYNQPFFNEFCMTYDGDVDHLRKVCEDELFLCGIKIDEHTVMFAATEKTDVDMIDSFVNIIKLVEE